MAERTDRRAGFDWFLLVVPLLALVAVWPFLTQSLPSTDDGALHMHRLAQLDRCLRHGVICLRWAPDFAHGYGYPGFNYYMNLPTVFAELWHLAGLSLPQAMAASFVVAVLVSGWGAYLLGRDVVNRYAGLVVTTAYVYAPYQFFDSAYRGNLPETWGLALLPWLFWSARRAALSRRWRAIVSCAVVYAALIWTHNIYTMVASPVLALYLLLLWWQQGHTWRDAWRLAAMIGLGLAMGAFFWVPAFFESGWTRYSPGLFDYRRAFLTLGEMLSWPPQLDLSRLNPYPPRSLNWGMLVLALLGGVCIVMQAVREKAHESEGSARPAYEFAFYAGVLLVAALLPLTASAPLWQLLSPLQIVQMPWRFLGLASLAGSVCTGWAIACLPRGRRLLSPALLGTGAAIVLLIGTAIPWTYAAPFPQPQDVGVDEMLRWEYGTGLIGGTSANEFLPIWSARLPDEPADPAMLTEDDPVVARFDETSLPEDADLVSAEYGIMRADLTVDTPRAFRARYKQLYFPGWRVLIDGEVVPPIATAPYGLLAFDVPAGEHRIVVQPTTTPLRATGAGIAVLGVLAAVGLLVLDRTPSAPAPSGYAGGWREAATLALLALLILALKEGLIDRTENLYRAHRYDGVRVPGARTDAQINYGDVLTLVGYDLPRHPVASGEPLRVDLYVSPRQPVDGDYMAYARLVDGEGRLWSLADNGTAEGFRPPPPTHAWPVDAYGHWAYLAYTLPGTPPGEYWIEVALFERDTWRGLNVLDERGAIEGLTARIGPVEVAAPRKPPPLESLGVDPLTAEQVTPSLRYLGSMQRPRSAEAGDPLELTVFWQAAEQPPEDYALQVSLASGDASHLLADGLPLGRRDYPTSAWEPGEVVRSPHHLRIPASVQAGRYALLGTVVDGNGTPVGAPVQLGEVEVRPTDRLLAVPGDIQHRVDANLGQVVTLLGYDLPAREVRPGDRLPVTLYWQAQREMDASYKAFLQLVGTDGVLAQVDAVPGGWSRPTTGWVSGEVVVDPYALDVPEGAAAGSYRLIAGLYDETTLARLPVLDAEGRVVSDHVVLDEVDVR